MHPAALAAYLDGIKEAGARAARLIDCPRCGRPVLRGDDHDSVSTRVTVDAEPVDLITEMLAVLDGRYTCNLIRSQRKESRPGAHYLYYREPWNIHAAKQPHPVHVEHRCKGTDRDANAELSTLW